MQYELVQEALETQRDKLDILESAEKEAQRLNEALERRMGGSTALDQTDIEAEREREQEQERERERERAVRAERASKKGSSFGLISAVKHSLSGMMDVDPEATRRANIAKTRDNISQLEDSLQASAQDLKYASATLQADLDRFQRQKVADLRELAIQFAKIHREWCRQNLETWQAAKAAVQSIEPHPNQPPKSAEPPEPVHISQMGDDGVYSDSKAGTGAEGERGDMGMGIGELRAEIDLIDAANVPLPLPEEDIQGAKDKGKGKERASVNDPLGPL